MVYWGRCRWAIGEFSGQVGRCIPADRCVGGRFSGCREGHVGAYCSRCRDGWYMDEDDLCYRCQGTITIAMLYLAQFAFLLVFMAVLFFGTDAFVDQIEFVLLSLRCVAPM